MITSIMITSIISIAYNMSIDVKSANMEMFLDKDWVSDESVPRLGNALESCECFGVNVG